MPAGDGTGPDGKGSRTGRGLGYCTGNSDPGFKKGSKRGRLGRNNDKSRSNRRSRNR